jgi:hypothetical protein
MTHATSKRRGRGEDSIYWDDTKGCYVGAVSLGYSPSGTRIRKRVMARTKTEVRVFVFELGVLLPSVIGSIGLFVLAWRFRLWWRVAAAIPFALLAACGSVLALDAIFGALTGAGAALIGVGFLGSFTFVAFVTSFPERTVVLANLTCTA